MRKARWAPGGRWLKGRSLPLPCCCVYLSQVPWTGLSLPGDLTERNRLRGLDAVAPTGLLSTCCSSNRTRVVAPPRVSAGTRRNFSQGRGRLRLQSCRFPPSGGKAETDSARAPWHVLQQEIVLFPFLVKLSLERIPCQGNSVPPPATLLPWPRNYLKGKPICSTPDHSTPSRSHSDKQRVRDKRGARGPARSLAIRLLPHY